MPLSAAVPVTLTAAGRKTLKKRTCGARIPYRDRLRAQIVLAAARGRDNARIAADLRISVDTARKRRGRFAARRLGGLKDLPRSGRPRRISELERAAMVALACQLPAGTGVPPARWSGPELAAELTAHGLVSSPVPASSVLRPNDFASLDDLSATLLAFTGRHNQSARPFNWKFTAADLAALLDRISAREHDARQPAALPEAA